MLGSTVTRITNLSSVILKVHNPDVIGWNTLLKEISNMNFCLFNSTENTILGSVIDNNLQDVKSSNLAVTELTTTGEMIKGFEKINRGSVSLLLPMSAKFAASLQQDQQSALELHREVIASSKISLMDMSRAVLPKYHQYNISLLVNLTSSTDFNDRANLDKGDVHACFHIEAPLALLKDLNSSAILPKECSISVESRQSYPRKLLAHTADHIPPSWCEQDGSTPLKLEYRDEPSWTVYLSPEDKKILNLHLMATSVFLFSLVAILLLVFFVKGIFGTRKVHSTRYSSEPSSMDASLGKENNA